MIEDFFPSILEIAGISDYETIQQRDGISFVPLLTEKGKVQDRDIYWHYPHSWGPSGPQESGQRVPFVRETGSWSTILTLVSGSYSI